MHSPLRHCSPKHNSQFGLASLIEPSFPLHEDEDDERNDDEEDEQGKEHGQQGGGRCPGLSCGRRRSGAPSQHNARHDCVPLRHQAVRFLSYHQQSSCKMKPRNRENGVETAIWSHESGVKHPQTTTAILRND